MSAPVSAWRILQVARRFAASRVLRPGKKIDFKQWVGVPTGSQNVTADGTFVGPGILNFLEPGTILRVRGRIQVGFNQAGLAATDLAVLTFGLGVFSTDAVTLGVTALPDPAAEPEYPWMWYGSVAMFSPSADTADPRIQQVLVVDTKAMRKVKPGESLAMVGQYVNSAGNPSIKVISETLRVLFGT